MILEVTKEKDTYGMIVATCESLLRYKDKSIEDIRERSGDILFMLVNLHALMQDYNEVQDVNNKYLLSRSFDFVVDIKLSDLASNMSEIINDDVYQIYLAFANESVQSTYKILSIRELALCCYITANLSILETLQDFPRHKLYDQLSYVFDIMSDLVLNYENLVNISPRSVKNKIIDNQYLSVLKHNQSNIYGNKLMLCNLINEEVPIINSYFKKRVLELLST